MKHLTRPVAVGLHVLLLTIALGAAAISAQGPQAQGRQGQAAGDGQDLPGISPAEVQQIFDMWALNQAQQRLSIRDDQFAQFLRRFKNLQDIRRQGLNERSRHVQQLQRLLTAAKLDENMVNDQLKAIRDLDVRVATDVAHAYELIDQVLDVRQRGQFRVFEEQMERQKIELVMRARQANRPKP